MVENVHHIRCPFSKPGYFTSVCAILGKAVALIDSGTTASPEEAILPYLKQLGKRSHEITIIVLTHAHFDHCGGAPAMKRKFGARVAVHALDRSLMEDPTLLNRQLNSRFPEIYPLDSIVDYEGMKGDLILHDQDETTLEDDVLRAIHTPGHSEGSIVLIDEDAGLCISGDSIQGRGEGRPLLFSSSIDYVKSIKRLMKEEIDTLILGHPFPPFNKGILRGEEGKMFLIESLKAIDELREKVSEVIDQSNETLSLSDIRARIPKAQPVTIGCIIEGLRH